MWEQKAAEVLADSHYGHFLMENKGKKALHPFRKRKCGGYQFATPHDSPEVD